jgi:hypothetical protein
MDYSKEFIKDSNYVLTRNYYAKDEVELMLVSKILNNNIREAYIWAFEYYYSGFDIYSLLWKIYLDFYYELNPKMEDYIFKKGVEEAHMDLDKQMSKLNITNENIDIDLSSLKLDDISFASFSFASFSFASKEKRVIKNIASIIKNMARCEKSLNSFMMRQTLSLVKPTTIYKGRKPDWIKNYPKKYENFVYSLYKGHVNNICYYLKELVYDNGNYNDETISSIREVLMDYLVMNNCLNEDEINIYNARWCRFIVKDDKRMWLQYIIAFISRLFVERGVLMKNDEMFYVSPNNDDIEMIYKIYVDESDSDSRDVLKHKRYVEVDETIGYFELERFTFFENDYDSFYQHIRYYGEYYTGKCPYWNKKIKSFGGELCDNSGKVIFQNETDKEKYYQLYCYDFEDQPKELIAMSHKHIEKQSWTNLVESFSDNNNLLITISDFKDLVMVY